ncbi:MAG: ABC transporter permease subunit/CPBP intramembrane protease, partial [Planctomycetota bacterium]|nr:ABC transporter permease subunit/CPBP intramembrane protease [Planctomycetota bacterium]
MTVEKQSNETTPPSLEPSFGMNDRQSLDFPRLKRLAGKELLEILRDRRTIITLVLMPILVYPLLGTIVNKFMLNSFANLEKVEYFIAGESELEAALLQRRVMAGNAILDSRATQSENGQEAVDSQNADSGKVDRQRVESLIRGKVNAEPEFQFVEAKDGEIDKYVQMGVFELGVRVVNKEILSRQMNDFQPVEFELVQLEGSPAGQAAFDYVMDRLEAFNRTWADEVFRLNRVEVRWPNEAKRLSLKSGEEAGQGKPSLLTFIPLMLVLMTMTGAVYPAIDVTAGERERGTMEILMAAPISRMALLFGKFIAVLAVAMLTALMNMVAMLLTIYTLGLDPLIFGEQGLSWLTALTIFLLLLVFASFFSAVLLALTSFARSFKEAQAYLIPLMLVALAPAVLSLFPDIQMTFGLALVPLVNIILLGRDLVAGQFEGALIMVTVVSTLLYGSLALGIAGRIFGSDAVLSGGSVSWTEFFPRREDVSLFPTLPLAMLLLAVLFPAFIVIGGMANRLDATIQTRLWINAGVTVFLFVGLPLMFCRFFRLNVRTANLLLAPRVLAVVGSLLLGASAWMFIYEIEVYSLTNQRMEALKEIFDSMKVELQQIPLAVKLLCLAVAPAVCEEFTFRGFLMSAFRRQTPTLIAIGVTAVLFGLFHVFVRDALMFERLLPSTLMGILLGWVCIRTGSVIPGMILHTIHNGLLICLAHFESELKSIGFGDAEQQH